MFHAPIDTHSELRILEIPHAGELYRLCDANRARLARWLPWVEGTRGADDTLEFIEGALRQFAEGRGFHAGIWHEGRLAGCIGMHPIDRQNESVSIGYWVDARVEGKGLATAACRIVVAHAFEFYGLHRVEIRCATDNHRSLAIPPRLGFQKEGILRGAQKVAGRWLDLVVFGRIRGESADQPSMARAPSSSPRA